MLEQELEPLNKIFIKISKKKIKIVKTFGFPNIRFIPYKVMINLI
jgi:hypothetical protein